MLRTSRSLLLLSCLTFLACATGPLRKTSVSDVSGDIAQANMRFSEALARGDAVALAGFYRSDAVLLPPQSGPVEGRDAIQKFWADLIQAGVKRLQLTTTDVQANGDLASETGNYHLEMQPASGTPLTDDGKYVVVWRRDADGTWKLYRDIYNTNQKPPAQ